MIAAVTWRRFRYRLGCLLVVFQDFKLLGFQSLYNIEANQLLGGVQKSAKSTCIGIDILVSAACRPTPNPEPPSRGG